MEIILKYQNDVIISTCFCPMQSYLCINLGKVKGLSALNLDGNPLDHPPLGIVKHGIKAIQQYLRDEHIRQSKCANENLDSDDEYYEEDRQTLIVPDIWASDDEDNQNQRHIPRSQPPTVLSRPAFIFLRKSKYFDSNQYSINHSPIDIKLFFFSFGEMILSNQACSYSPYLRIQI